MDKYNLMVIIFYIMLSVPIVVIGYRFAFNRGYKQSTKDRVDAIMELLTKRG